MKVLLLAVAAACLAVPSHTVDVKTVGDESSGIFTKIISDAPAAASDAGVYSADDGVDPIFYDAQGRRQSSNRRRQQGSYLEQPNRYQIGNRFSGGNLNSIRNQEWQKTQTGIKFDSLGRPIPGVGSSKFDSFGRPIQGVGSSKFDSLGRPIPGVGSSKFDNFGRLIPGAGSQVNRPSNVFQNRVTAGQSGNLLPNQFGQSSVGFSQGNRAGVRPGALNQFSDNSIGFGSSSGQLTQTSFAGQRLNQQIGLSRPTIGQNLPNQFTNQQAAIQQGQLRPSGLGLSSQQQFGQQFARPGNSQFGQLGQQTVNQFGQQAQSAIGQTASIPFNQRQVGQFDQRGNQLGQISSGQFGQQSGGGSRFGQQPTNQFGGQATNQFGQQTGLQFGQQQSTFGQQQFGSQIGGQFAQQSNIPSGQRFIGQQSGFQQAIPQVGSQFNRIQNQQSNTIGNSLRQNEIIPQRITGSFG